MTTSDEVGDYLCLDLLLIYFTEQLGVGILAEPTWVSSHGDKKRGYLLSNAHSPKARLSGALSHTVLHRALPGHLSA